MTTLADLAASAPLRLSEDEEIAALEAAQAGDAASALLLLTAYAPALLNLADRYAFDGTSRRGTTIHPLRTQEDAHATALLAALEAIHAVDLETYDGLGGILTPVVRQALSQNLADTAPGTVPGRTMRRFHAILRASGGDIDAARELSRTLAMRPETFDAALVAIRPAEGITDAADPAQCAALDAVVDMTSAFAAVDDLAADICRRAYGLDGYEPAPDVEIARALGMSRPTVQRLRSAALLQMCAALSA